MPVRDHLKHLLIPARFIRDQFRPVVGNDPERPRLNARQMRYLHARKLEEEVERAILNQSTLARTLSSDPEQFPGICLDIEGSTEISLDLSSLEDRTSRRHPIELLNVKRIDDKLYATIFIPTDRIERFTKKIQRYGDLSRDPNGVLPTTLAIDSIEAIKLADIRSFWMDKNDLPANSSQAFRFEAWLRKGTLAKLREVADDINIKVSQHSISFHECEICLLTGSIETLALLQLTHAPLIGFRYQDAVANFFDQITPFEQQQWAENIANRIEPANPDAPAVCLLDTGVYQAHPILQHSLSEQDCDAYDPTWLLNDHHGHGTRMAGVALLDDLTSHVQGVGIIKLEHRLESIKILPPVGQNAEELYGWITQECVGRAQVNAPNRKRVFCLAVTSGKCVGKPTAWSATIDKLAMGVDSTLAIDDSEKQLFVISAGNIHPSEISQAEYPALNDLEEIENPSHAWNAVCVGAHTDKSFTTNPMLDGWDLLAQPGDICPTSRTSIAWMDKQWPIKPDIVFEGGNYLSDGRLISSDPDLSLLTTGAIEPLDSMTDTSAAVAQAAKLAAILHARYPDFWPETIRGLMIHSSNWTAKMLRGEQLSIMLASSKEKLLRRFGYGVPSEYEAFHSASNRVCLILQETLQPFTRSEAGSITYSDIKYHEIPWPEEFLRENGQIKVQLRVTLSYFIEPNPSERLPVQQYSYASHRLRFAIQRPTEDFPTFKERLNDINRTDDYSSRGADKWLLGTNTRDKGSVSSDIWTGTAADLANQKYIAIMPLAGWWKYRKHLNRHSNTVRYALIITAKFENDQIDVYTKIENLIPSLIDLPV